MVEQIVSPFSGDPLTRQFQDGDGRAAFEIRARTLRPENARQAERWAHLISIGATAAGLFVLADQPEPASVSALTAVFAVPFLAVRPLRERLRRLLRSETRIVVTCDRVSVSARGRKPLHYDRSLPHQFGLILHDEANEEKEHNDYVTRKAQRLGQVIRQRRYYGESYHVVLEYFGARTDLLTVYGQPQALRVLARLQQCDRVVEGQLRSGKVAAIGPADSFADLPGDIPRHAAGGLT